MTDYLGPLTLGASGTYTLLDWSFSEGTAQLSIVVDGTSSDNLLTLIEALAAACRPGNSLAHYEVGATNPVIYRVTGCDAFVLGEISAWLASYVQQVDLTLSTVATPAGALTTLYTAQAVNAPASLSLAALLGTRATSLDVTIDDAAGTDMHSVWCALAPTALSDAKWLIYASALTWTTMSSGTDSESWSHTDRYTTSASWQTAPLDTSQYPAGTYKLLARVKQSAGTGYVMDSQNQVAVAFTRATWHIVEVGDVELPVADTAFGTAANLTLSVRSDGTNTADVNAFVLLPLDYGMFAYHPPIATTEIDQIDCGPTGIWLDGAHDSTYLLGGPLTATTLAAHTSTLVATASPTGNDFPADWGKTDGACTADTSRFKITGASKYVWYAATNVATPLVTPGVWYELNVTRDVDSYVAGNVTAGIVWQDVDGNTVRSDTLSTVAANDAAPVALSLYARAPYHAARAQVKLGHDGTGNVTSYWSAVSLRRCPLRLIVVAEDGGGQVDGSYVHPVTVTLKYAPHYEVGR